MTATELSHWKAYSVLEPFGPMREEYRIGVICATLAAVNGIKNIDSGSFFPLTKPKEPIKIDNGSGFSNQQQQQMASFAMAAAITGG
jgi:hypothetical protein